MIHYHGGPLTPDKAAAEVLQGRHVFVSHAHPAQIDLVADVCQSFALDCGAYTAFRAGRPITDWSPYYRWAGEWLTHPGCDWAVVPDVVNGSEEENDDLLADWPFQDGGVPVWHMDESLERLERLVCSWPRVCLSSTGPYLRPRTDAWWSRMALAMAVVCDKGRPRVKLHGLRMLDPRIFTRLPLASADSTNVARNIKYDTAWTGSYAPRTVAARGIVLAGRIEDQQSCPRVGADVPSLLALGHDTVEEAEP